ncbi:hypothetical protein CGT93_10440 [Vibrio metoecus]|uniref:hypothetical protein n=1 Tax=Vibrio metoecus TaxID=1481663 RepID=UPI000BA95D6E|nr:hypothetical protein [Vibrio metoecus]PAR54064.1 hypothetical protein CGT93_10440 [Vibrio metoecus]
MEIKMAEIFGSEGMKNLHLRGALVLTGPEAEAAVWAVKNHDRLIDENKQLQEALEQAKAMSIESINREDLVMLLSTGFRHAEIKGSFEIDDLYDAFNAMVYKRKKLLSEIGGE